MNLKEARALKQGNRVFTTDNRSFVFIALDCNKDIIVECKSAVKGWITLLRIQCQPGSGDYNEQV